MWCKSTVCAGSISWRNGYKKLYLLTFITIQIKSIPACGYLASRAHDFSELHQRRCLLYEKNALTQCLAKTSNSTEEQETSFFIIPIHSTLCRIECCPMQMCCIYAINFDFGFAVYLLSRSMQLNYNEATNTRS
ncbi:hypothetical protein EDC96DRAFT_547445 [Choanephora cucurbitarum]|nr:hypothetical protein EDC96DRAFT_547445 [Choanephora cucurbitarum]